jgi:hypothetical protein
MKCENCNHNCSDYVKIRDNEKEQCEHHTEIIDAVETLKAENKRLRGCLREMIEYHGYNEKTISEKPTYLRAIKALRGEK